MKKVSINKEKVFIGAGKVVGAIAGSGVAVVLHYAVQAVTPPEIRAVEKMLVGIGELAIGTWVSDEVGEVIGANLAGLYEMTSRKDKKTNANPYYGGFKVKEA